MRVGVEGGEGEVRGREGRVKIGTEKDEDKR